MRVWSFEDANGELIARRRRELDRLGRRPGLHFQAARQREVVERRSGHGRRLRLFLSAHPGSGDGGRIRQHPLSHQERREDQQGRDEGRTSSAPRRSMTTRWRSRSRRRPPTSWNSDASDRPIRSTRRRSRSSATTCTKPGNLVTNGAYTLKESVRRTTRSCSQEPELPRCGERQDRRRQLHADEDRAGCDAPLRGRRTALLRRHSGRPDQLPEAKSSATR